jgi:hypothetical protein
MIIHDLKKSNIILLYQPYHSFRRLHKTDYQEHSIIYNSYLGAENPVTEPMISPKNAATTATLLMIAMVTRCKQAKSKVKK